ncbi:protein transport protein Sec31A-like [Amphibalanus amphitrite]|uniref:protein transport protein Sec31A-like n=1 Tax=Amphibalanus amphitrite TaxID=1232801 RepID=UPI001C921633|nr:protein transport protein Sec31A-like [Amphibalanus amphitrite]
MEQAMTLFRANQVAGTATALTSGGMQDKLLRYAQLLTSQGSLETALGYLGDCTDPAAVSLCERVQHCLTPAPAVGAGQYQRQTASAARFPAAPAAAPAANRGYQMHSGQPSPGVPSARDSRMSSYSQQPAQPHHTQTGAFQQPGTFQQPAGAFQPPVAPVAPLVPTPAAQPSAPPSGGSGSGYRLGGRRQYAADPSLAGAAGGYGMSSQGYGSMAPVSSAPYGQMAAPTAAATVFTPSFSEPQPYPAQSQPAVQPFVPTLAAPAGTDYGAGAGAAPPPAAPAGAGPIITAVSSGPGWNDPPPLRRSSKKTTTSTTSVLQTVTQPIYNPAEMAAAAAAQPPPGQHYPMAGMYQPAPSGQYSPYQPIAAAQQQQPPAAAAPTPPPPAPQEPPPPKGPVPPEHAPLQDTLERLRETCAAAATTAQARRRLEEVSRRLEVLYDMLRASSLSPGTIQGLHQLIGWLQCSDWASAQQQLNALVAASNMAEIAGFMPGIKSLLQIAAQMQVRI